jgi:hypothetical protein
MSLDGYVTGPDVTPAGPSPATRQAPGGLTSGRLTSPPDAAVSVWPWADPLADWEVAA